ncbi:MAG: DUF4142 domain-containing protein [Sphingomonadaceae bacterium]|nr:DUF4142 domain-containing protein [Sphingomonadaceae bacterium]
MRNTVAVAVILAVAALLPTTARAQQPGSRPTREYLMAAAQSDQFEILSGTTALAQTTDPGLRAFATQMIHDHGETSRQLKDTAAREGLAPPPDALGGDQAQMLNALQSLRGADFDKTYARQQALAHHSALTVQQQYAANGDDAALRQLASTTTGLISGHLAMAEKMKDALDR